ncbi:MAG TPA: hypothetical protein VNA14_00980 [Mycobacteriales bacterium]|nr:hypothetical protein [Mycobacteriales bacterium]
MERLARRSTGRRADGWLIAYAAVAAAAAVLPAPRPPAQRRRNRLGVVTGVALAGGGYPAGRALAGDRPVDPPPDDGWREVLALGAVVPLAEELAWGRQVERRVGPVAATALFAVKHPLVDGRWRRTPGLGAFWLGLALVRRRSPAAAAALHCTVNAGGVALGRIKGVDQF